VGDAARKVFAEAREMLSQIVRGGWVRANGVFGIYPAAQVGGEDIEIYRDEAKRERLMTWHNLGSRTRSRAGARTYVWRISSRRGTAGCATGPGLSR